MVLLVFWVACAFLGAVIGNRNDAALGGFILSVLFGPLGVIASFALDGRRKCSTCGTRLNNEQKFCPMCVLNPKSEMPQVAKWMGPNSRLRPCPDCRAEVSKRVAACPHCGCPLDSE